MNMKKEGIRKQSSKNDESSHRSIHRDALQKRKMFQLKRRDIYRYRMNAERIQSIHEKGTYTKILLNILIVFFDNENRMSSILEYGVEK